ncbi:MAG: hypothetical protein JKY80_01785 [Mariprofundaceae bacterium]|nr:hypothetical protein [Mariprofundaceae bacterium]
MISIFIDYDNLTPIQKESGILDVVNKILLRAPIELNKSRITCDVRVYGGWYEDNEMTQKAQDVAVKIQDEFPEILKLSAGGEKFVQVRINAELALSMLEEPSHHLFDTFRRKGKPSNIRFKNCSELDCSDQICLIPQVKKLLKTGRCPKVGCINSTESIVYRVEQKLVDTMLTCDLIYAPAMGYKNIIIVSGDDDFLPPLRTLLLRGTSAIRFLPKYSAQRSGSPNVDAKLIEMEL